MTNKPTIVALLPMKAHSERVKGKNFRLFNGKPLFRWILDTLLSIEEIASVVINTDARAILADNGLADGARVAIRDRKPEICGDFVSMNLVLADDVAAVPADYYLINVVGMPLDSTIFLARMIFGGVLQRHPSLKMCVVHGGGYAASYPARFDHAYRVRPECREHIDQPPSAYLGRLYFDTMVYDVASLTDLVDRYGADHILLGTDYPYDMAEGDPVGLVRGLGLAPEDEAKILGANAATLLAPQLSDVQ